MSYCRSPNYVEFKTIYLLNNVQFKAVGKLWVPQSCSITDKTSQRFYERTRIDLRPDFNLINAFELPISNGTPITIEGETGNYYWRNGRITDKEGRDAL